MYTRGLEPTGRLMCGEAASYRLQERETTDVIHINESVIPTGQQDKLTAVPVRLFLDENVTRHLDSEQIFKIWQLHSVHQ